MQNTNPIIENYKKNQEKYDSLKKRIETKIKSTLIDHVSDNGIKNTAKAQAFIDLKPIGVKATLHPVFEDWCNELTKDEMVYIISQTMTYECMEHIIQAIEPNDPLIEALEQIITGKTK